jgi:hypothetical protein
MPGVATHFEILRLTIDELEHSPSAPLQAIAGVMSANPAYAHLGAVGAALADFLPPEPQDLDQPLETYADVWRSLFTIIGGDIGLFATLKRLKEILGKLDRIANQEDFDALKAIRDSGEIDDIEKVGHDFADLISGLPSEALSIAGIIGEGLRPKVCTSSPADPVPPPGTWQVRDFLHWKKSGPFVKKLIEKAVAAGDPRFLAYAYGFLVAYASDVCGSAFINSAVGGPARTQWWRQRFVKNYVDAWVHGFYSSSATMVDDAPSPPYDQWPNLCAANLHEKIELEPLDPVDVMKRIKLFQPFPENALPPEFAAFWIDAFAETYGAPPPGSPVTVSGLNGAFVMTWLVLWFQTGGAVLGCNLTEPLAPPQGCGDAPAELDPFQTGPDGGPLLPPKPEPDTDIDEGAVVCGIVLIILGVLGILTLNFDAGVKAIVAGVKLISSAADVDWQKLRCQLYWLRMYLYLGLKGLHQLLTIAAFEYPLAKSLADDQETLELLGRTETWTTGRNLVRSQVRLREFPSKCWDGSILTLNKPPTDADPGFEKPGTVGYRAAAYPSFFVGDNTLNPLAQGDVKTAPGSFPLREDPLTPQSLPVQFGNAVANAVDLFANLDTDFPSWNLDGDRGLAYATWQFSGFYDPDAVAIEPEP